MAQRFIDSSSTVAVALLVASFAMPALALQGAPAVGSVTLVLGQATRISADGVRNPIVRGTSVVPGDRFETALGGHVHIRFIDDALVSVRPSSRLVVEEYQFDPARVADSKVRFRLETGIARAISGAAAEGAKERFRLNTPLVAIGVRGTDFVVNSQAEQTTAHVNQGAIVMTPLGAGCTANTLGPCNTTSAMLVSAQMGDVLAEYRSGLGQPELKRQQDVRTTAVAALSPDAPVVGATASTVASVSKSAGGNASGGATAANGNGNGNSFASSTAVAKLDDSVSSKPEGASVQVSAVIRNDLISAVVDGRTPPPALPPPAVTPLPPAAPPQTMAWGHWTAPQGSSDFSEPFRAASVGREVTVGNSEHVLYRTPGIDGPTTTIQPTLGEVSFKLQQASAMFRPWGGANEAATASSGALSIDFAARKFQTNLQLSHPTGGSNTLSASGVVLPDGIFGGATSTQKVIGATTFDGKSAGYFFDKTVNTGVFNGITSWGK